MMVSQIYFECENVWDSVCVCKGGHICGAKMDDTTSIPSDRVLERAVEWCSAAPGAKGKFTTANGISWGKYEYSFALAGREYMPSKVIGRMEDAFDSAKLMTPNN